jgi:hypothetical protein
MCSHELLLGISGWCTHRLGWLRTSRNAVNPSLEAPEKTSCFLRSWKSLANQVCAESSVVNLKHCGAQRRTIANAAHSRTSRRTPIFGSLTVCSRWQAAEVILAARDFQNRRKQDVFAGAYRDVFTAFLKVSCGGNHPSPIATRQPSFLTLAYKTSD